MHNYSVVLFLVVACWLLSVYNEQRKRRFVLYGIHGVFFDRQGSMLAKFPEPS